MSCLLLSAENIFHYGDERPLRLLRAAFPDSDFTLVAILRRQEDWLRSRYSENVVGGWISECRSFDRYTEDMITSGGLDNERQLDRLRAIFTPDKVETLDYDALISQDCLLQAFCDVAGLTFDSQILFSGPKKQHAQDRYRNA